MWRRLCIDLDEDGTLIGGSVEFYDDTTVTRSYVVVMEVGWAESHDEVSGYDALLEVTPPQLRLWEPSSRRRNARDFGYPSSSVIDFHRPPA